MTVTPVIEVTGLTKIFDNKTVVDSVDLMVKKGEVFGFLGPNGSGKTTTIRMLCGLLTPDAGQGICLGYDILTQSRQIRQQVGYMTQKFSFYTDLSIEENLNFTARVYGLDNRKQRVASIMEGMGLSDRRRQLAKDLSGGRKQRLALAACLLHEPQLLLLDEPTAGVDPLARREFWDKIHTLSEKGITTLISTHYMDEAERCTRLAYLAYGHLLITGSVSEVIASTHLFTWEISGKVTTALLQQAKALKGVVQAVLSGNRIYVSGYDESQIITGLNALAEANSVEWRPAASSLEDAFISLVTKSQGETF